MDQVIRMGVGEIFGWKKFLKTPAEQEVHDKQVKELMSKNFMDYPTILPACDDEKIPNNNQTDFWRGFFSDLNPNKE